MQSYHQPYQQGYCGLGNLRGNPDNNLRGKFGIANCLFRLAISARPCPVGSTARHTTPVADPSLPTTERGISGRDGKKHTKKRSRGEPTFYNFRRYRLKRYGPGTWVTQWIKDQAEGELLSLVDQTSSQQTSLAIILRTHRWGHYLDAEVQRDDRSHLPAQWTSQKRVLGTASLDSS